MNINIIKTDFQGYGIKQFNKGIYLCHELDKTGLCGIHVYDDDSNLESEIIFDNSLSVGNVFCVYIDDLSLCNKKFRIVSGGKEIISEYCHGIWGLEEFGTKKSVNDLYSVEKTIKVLPNWNKDNTLKTPYSDSVYYICHVRGLTMADSSVKSKKGTFKALTEKVTYFNRLGVTGLILMPVYERIENPTTSLDNSSLYKTPSMYKSDNDENRTNFWGFGKGYYYALKRSYSESDDCITEFKMMIMSCHNKGIEVILTFDFEGLNYTKILDVLRYYICNYHIDGFRLFNVSETDKLINDPFLKDTKLLLDNYFDISKDNNIIYKNIASFDRDFSKYVRKFIKSDDDCVRKISYFVRENHDNYATLRNVTDYNGLTLYDSVTYDSKHNEENGENNQDGTDYNYSWNCGEEGDSSSKQVNKLRIKQIKNLILMTTLCQGVPVINGGDELLNTNKGNNNPYCQDNEIGWINSTDSISANEIRKFMKDALAFRKRHSILHQPGELKLFDYMSCKLPDVSFHGEEAWKYNTSPESRCFAVLYAGDYSRQYTNETEESLLIIYNMHWDDKEINLPSLKDKKWNLLCTTSSPCSFDENKAKLLSGERYIAKGRSISVIISSK